MNMTEVFAGLNEGTLSPRYHTGVGVLQLYLTDDVRLHVWHPDLAPKLESFGNRHNHRFDLESTVLHGSLVDIRLTPQPRHWTGEFHLYTVKPAHHGETPVPQLLDGNLYTVEMFGADRIEVGQTYQCSRGQYHESRAEGLTVTLMRKSNQVEEWARIIAHKDQSPIHGMDHGFNPNILRECFLEGLHRLGSSALARIDDEIS